MPHVMLIMLWWCNNKLGTSEPLWCCDSCHPVMYPLSHGKVPWRWFCTKTVTTILLSKGTPNVHVPTQFKTFQTPNLVGHLNRQSPTLIKTSSALCTMGDHSGCGQE